MDLIITGHHVEVSQAMRQFAVKKLERIGRHCPKSAKATLTMTVEQLSVKDQRQRVDVVMYLNGCEIYVEQAANNMYVAVDRLAARLTRTVQRHTATERRRGPALKHCA